MRTELIRYDDEEGEGRSPQPPQCSGLMAPLQAYVLIQHGAPHIPALASSVA